MSVSLICHHRSFAVLVDLIGAEIRSYPALVVSNFALEYLTRKTVVESFRVGA